MLYTLYSCTVYDVRQNDINTEEQTKKTRSHAEMVGDMSRVTLNFDLSKLPFVRL